MAVAKRQRHKISRLEPINVAKPDWFADIGSLISSSKYQTDEPPCRKRCGVNLEVLNAPRGGELNSCPPLEGLSATGGLKI